MEDSQSITYPVLRASHNALRVRPKYRSGFLSRLQFVPFREFTGGRYGSNPQTSQAYLAKEVLAEVPDQITGYMKKRGIKPRKPAPVPDGGAVPAGGDTTQATAPSW